MQTLKLNLLAHFVMKRPIVIGLAIIVAAIIITASISYYYQAKTPKEIVVGVSLPLTGPFASPTQLVKNGYEIWADEVNQKGGLLGMKVRLLIYDNKGDSKSVISDYERLITVDKVDLCLGTYTSGLALVAEPIFEKYHMPVIHATAASEQIYAKNFNYTFTVNFPVSWFGKGFIDMLMTQNPKPKNMAVLALSELYPKSVAQGAADYAKTVGIDVPFFEEYTSDITTLVPQLTKLKSLNPDIVLVSGYTPHAILATREMKELGINPKAVWESVGPSDPQYRSAVGADGENIFTIEPWVPTLPGVESFVNAYKVKTGGSLPDYGAALAYVSGKVMENAVTTVGSLDPVKIRDAISNFKGQILGVPIEFAHNAKVSQWTLNGINIGFPGLTTQLRSGSTVIVWPSAMAGTTPVYPKPAW